jgi:hypothetical protein
MLKYATDAVSASLHGSCALMPPRTIPSTQRLAQGVRLSAILIPAAACLRSLASADGRGREGREAVSSRRGHAPRSRELYPVMDSFTVCTTTAHFTLVLL